ncbi:hypothetical protein J3E69DRAFT_4335 [Trichoderma sp. SZMC 28015]
MTLSFLRIFSPWLPRTTTCGISKNLCLTFTIPHVHGKVLRGLQVANDDVWDFEESLAPFSGPFQAQLRREITCRKQYLCCLQSKTTNHFAWSDGGSTTNNTRRSSPADLLDLYHAPCAR